MSNVVVWKKVYAQFRRAVMTGRLLRITGHVQREGIVVHVIAHSIEDVSHYLSRLGHPMDDAVGITQPQADDAPRSRTQPRAMHPAIRPSVCSQAGISTSRALCRASHERVRMMCASLHAARKCSPVVRPMSIQESFFNYRPSLFA